MPTKAQAKTTVTAAAVTFNNDIDVTLAFMSGNLIKDGAIAFPFHGTIVFDAGGNYSVAEGLLNGIKSSLITQSREFKIQKNVGRRIDPTPDLISDNYIRIETSLMTYIVVNFPPAP